MNPEALTIDQMTREAYRAWMYQKFREETDWKPRYRWLLRETNPRAHDVGGSAHLTNHAYIDREHIAPDGKRTVIAGDGANAKQMTGEAYDAWVQKQGHRSTLAKVQTPDPPRIDTPTKSWKYVELRTGTTADEIRAAQAAP